jgi:hypothetical protein
MPVPASMLFIDMRVQVNHVATKGCKRSWQIKMGMNDGDVIRFIRSNARDRNLLGQ